MKISYFYLCSYIPYSNSLGSGVTTSWDECKLKIKGIKSRYKKFPSRELAKSWLANDFNVVSPKAVYFDAGTGSGETEVRVTNEKGESLIKNSNSRGNLSVKGQTNNFGELMGMKIALELALSSKIKKVCGDSKLVIEYWSKGFIKKQLPEQTVKLAEETKIIREKFEKGGGKVEHISGDINPADLGYHR